MRFRPPPYCITKEADPRHENIIARNLSLGAVPLDSRNWGIWAYLWGLGGRYLLSALVASDDYHGNSVPYCKEDESTARLTTMKPFLGSLFVSVLINLLALWLRPIPLTIADSKSHILAETPMEYRYLMVCRKAGGQWRIQSTVVTESSLPIIIGKDCELLDSYLDKGGYVALTIEKPHNIFLGNTKGTVIENVEVFYNSSQLPR